MRCQNGVQTDFGYRACKKCGPCRARKAWAISQKLRLELEYNTRAWFCTLTFADEPSPEEGRVAVRLWLKGIQVRQRRLGRKIRYFWVEERGSLGRYHVHCIVFCRGELSKRELFFERGNREMPLWRCGYFASRLVRSARRMGAYLQKYCVKQLSALNRYAGSPRLGGKYAHGTRKFFDLTVPSECWLPRTLDERIDSWREKFGSIRRFAEISKPAFAPRQRPVFIDNCQCSSCLARRANTPAQLTTEPPF